MDYNLRGALCPSIGRKSARFKSPVLNGETYPLCLRYRMVAPKMSIHLHCKSTPVFMAEPARHSRNIHSSFNAR